MLTLCAVLVFLALTSVAYFFYYRLTKTKGDLFAARRQLAHAEARHEAAKKRPRRRKHGACRRWETWRCR
jgi:hypothetical protein